MKDWKKNFVELVELITDNSDLDFKKCLIDEGLENEERANELTLFIKTNGINCKNLWKEEKAYRNYQKLIMEISKNWEK